MNYPLSRVKRLGIILFLLSISGCGSVTKEEIDTCINICKPNGGVNYIYVDSRILDDCWCNNGAHITMYKKVIESNKSKW